MSTNQSNGRQAPRSLKRSMGLSMATALVIGNMVGSGVFLLPASLAAAAGPVSIVSWLFTGVGAMLLALAFAGLARTFPRTGGLYAYSRRPFSDFVAFQTAWGYWIAVLPAHRGEEVDATVIDGPRSVVFEQAANRLPTTQALLHALISENGSG